MASSLAAHAVDPQEWMTCVACPKIWPKSNKRKAIPTHLRLSKDCARKVAIIHNNPEDEQYNEVVTHYAKYVSPLK